MHLLNNIRHRAVFAFLLLLTLSLLPAHASQKDLAAYADKLFSAAFGRPLLTSDAWNLGARFIGQVGSAKAAFTCPEEVLGVELPA